ncbi:MAG: AMP-binding protein [Solirubrobacteraceae bacterium]|nr:AMP-binding protein [Solirubrobacteraceae bacterium]
MNGAALLLDPWPRRARALVCRDERGRTELTFGEVADGSAAVAAQLLDAGVGPGDVVVTLLGSRAEWVLGMVGALHVGAVVLPCLEQLRPHDLGMRLRVTRPKAVITRPEHRELVAAACAEARSEADARGFDYPVVLTPTLGALLLEGAGSRPPQAELSPTDPALITFTSGTSGPAKAVVHGLKYVAGQRVQAEHWLGAREGELSWCTAAPGWSKSARNVFMAPWLCGAAALLHDGRFDPAERLELLREEEPDVLCMAPTEYRLIAKRTALDVPRSVRRLVAAGEALDPAVLHAWHEASGLWVRDGYGQTETGQLTAPPDGSDPVPGSMGRPLPGFGLEVRVAEAGDEVGELVIRDPASVPTFFLGYLDEATGKPVPHHGSWPTGDRVRQDPETGDLFFVGRSDDVIVSSGYRIGPFEVESVLVEHPAVAEAAAVAATDAERGSIVRAVVVLRDGFTPGDELTAELQAHVRERTAPYKYPRRVDFVDELPKTASGKVRRALLREQG